MSQLFVFQHDKKYISIDSATYTHSLHSPEDFFIRKFNNDRNLTSKELRLEEEVLMTKLMSSPSVNEPLPTPANSFDRLRIRDFIALCRGEALVTIIIIYVFIQ